MWSRRRAPRAVGKSRPAWWPCRLVEEGVRCVRGLGVCVVGRGGHARWSRRRAVCSRARRFCVVGRGGHAGWSRRGSVGSRAEGSAWWPCRLVEEAGSVGSRVRGFSVVGRGGHAGVDRRGVSFAQSEGHGCGPEQACLVLSGVVRARCDQGRERRCGLTRGCGRFRSGTGWCWGCVQDVGEALVGVEGGPAWGAGFGEGRPGGADLCREGCGLALVADQGSAMPPVRLPQTRGTSNAWQAPRGPPRHASSYR